MNKFILTDPDEANMNPVAEAYNRDVEKEWTRLVRDPYRTIEFQVVLQHIQKYLPLGSRVLDAGGGPGRYAIELCRIGYGVTLLDLSPGCIETAKRQFRSEPEDIQNRLAEAVVGDVRDLSRFETGHFDGILCLDPLTYIDSEEERVLIIQGLLNVVKPGGIVFIGVRGYLALLRTVLTRFDDLLLEDEFEQFIPSGNTPVRGVMCHFFRAHEIRRLAESCGLTTLTMAGCEGLSTGLEEATNRIASNRAKWERWMALIHETSSEPAVVDMAGHMLYVGRAPGDKQDAE